MLLSGYERARQLRQSQRWHFLPVLGGGAADTHRRPPPCPAAAVSEGRAGCGSDGDLGGAPPPHRPTRGGETPLRALPPPPQCTRSPARSRRT